ncbi:MAG: hypothetical protein N2D54_11475 [Chloroflexota bacterium]
MNKFKIGAVIGFLVISVLACRSTNDTVELDPTNVGIPEVVETNEEPAEELPERPAPNPLTVTPLLEEENTVNMLVSPGEETSLSVTGADGTIFTLTFPAFALLSPVEISMTPVTALEGLPESDGPLHAVQLEPEGLTLMEPAMLTIQSPSGSAGFTAFSTYAGGENFHLSPSFDQNGAIKIPLMHFSTPGVTGAGDNFLLQIRESYPQSALAGFWKQHVMEDMGIQDPAQRREELINDFNYWVDDISAAYIDRAQDDHTLVDKAISEYLIWYNWFFMMMDISEDGILIIEQLVDRNVEARTMLANGIWNALTNHISPKCTFDKDPDQAIQMMRYFAIIEKLDLWGEDDDGSLQRGRVVAMVEDCVNFRLLLESSFVTVSGQLSTHKVRSNNMLILPVYDFLEGYSTQILELKFDAGPVEYQKFTMPEAAPRCQLDTEDGKMTVKMFLGLNLYDHPPRLDETIILVMNFPEKPLEIMECPLVNPATFTLWVDMLRLMRFTTPIGNENLFFRLDKVEGKNYYAIYHVSQTLTQLLEETGTQLNDADLEVKEITTLKLFHVPD